MKAELEKLMIEDIEPCHFYGQVPHRCVVLIRGNHSISRKRGYRKRNIEGIRGGDTGGEEDNGGYAQGDPGSRRRGRN